MLIRLYISKSGYLFDQEIMKHDNVIGPNGQYHYIQGKMAMKDTLNRANKIPRQTYKDKDKGKGNSLIVQR